MTTNRSIQTRPRWRQRVALLVVGGLLALTALGWCVAYVA
jgi:hypothetical protein